MTEKSKSYVVQGAGLGLRRDLLADLREFNQGDIDFMEVAPENWMGVGGRLGKRFRSFTERFPFICHGLSLSIGGLEPLDMDFLKRLKVFLDEHNVLMYSEHLSYCSDHGHLYDLMPIPFTDDAVSYVARRIKQVQEVLERPFVVENVSYYAAPGQEMTELEFINAVLEEADCQLLLDVNNIYVNSINHSYDPFEFLNGLDAKRAAYVHVAGHYDEYDDLKVDTHGSDVKPDVWGLLDEAYKKFGVMPTLLERDFNFPPVTELLAEVEQIRKIQRRWQSAGMTEKASK